MRGAYHAPVDELVITHPSIQERTRQLLGLVGGGPIEPIPAVQPVAIVAGFPAQRQPQLERGDMLVRRFLGCQLKAAAGAGQYSAVGVRPGSSTTVLHVTRLWITNATLSVLEHVWGIGANITAGSYGTAAYLDTRLPGNDLGPVEVQIHDGNQATLPVGNAMWRGNIPASTTVEFDIDVVLTADLAGGDRSLLVAPTSVNTALGYVTFEGVAYTRR